MGRIIQESDELLNSQMSARDKTGLGYGTQMQEIVTILKLIWRLVFVFFDVRSSDEESTPANDRSSKADGYHVSKDRDQSFQERLSILTQKGFPILNGLFPKNIKSLTFVQLPEILCIGSYRDELKFNLFSVSQMCDKKNSVLFTETECLIPSPSFNLLEKSVD
ncbi:hypothetical protein Tco_0433227 [Tanacetum coccineum]